MKDAGFHILLAQEGKMNFVRVFFIHHCVVYTNILITSSFKYSYIKKIELE